MASVTMTTPAITKSPITKNPIYVGSRETSYVTSDCCTNCGNCATIPAKISSDMPFPTPCSVISSPSHISSMAPAVIATTATVSSTGLITPRLAEFPDSTVCRKIKMKAIATKIMKTIMTPILSQMLAIKIAVDQ